MHIRKQKNERHLTMKDFKIKCRGEALIMHNCTVLLCFLFVVRQWLRSCLLFLFSLFFLNCFGWLVGCCCCCCFFLVLLLSLNHLQVHFLNHLMKYIKCRWNYVSSVLAIIVWYNLITGTCSHDTGPSIVPLHSSVSYLYPSRQTHRYPLFVNPTWHIAPFPGQGFPWSWHKFLKY